MADPNPNNKKRLSMNKSLVLFFTVTGLILVVSLSLTSYFQITRAVEKEHKEFVSHSVAEFDQAVKSFVGYRLKTLADYAEFPVLKQGVMQPETSPEYLSDFFDSISLLGSQTILTLLDYKGTDIFSSVPEPLPEDFRQGLVQKLVNSNEASFWRISRFRQAYYWFFSVPVFYNGHREGIVIAQIPVTDFLKDQNISYRTGDNQVDLVLDDDIVFSIGPKLTTPLDIYPVSDSPLKMHFRWAYDRDNQVEKIGLVYQTSLVLVLISLGSFIVFFFLTNRYIRIPLNLFKETSRKLANDYDGARMPGDLMIHELAQGAESFNVMADHISKRVKELEGLKHQLEQDVENRTHEIKQEQENLKSIFNTAPTGMILIDRNRNVKMMNKVMADQFLDDVRSTFGLRVGDLLQCENAEGFGQHCGTNADCPNCHLNMAIRNVFETGKDNRGVDYAHQIMVNERPAQIHYLINASRLTMGGENHVLMAFTNVSALRQALNELQKAKDSAELANRTKSEFLANMSHEIRTPLNAVLGFSDLLADTVTQPKQKHYLSAIHSSGKSLLTIINDILDLSKFEAGLLTLDLDYISVERIVDEVRLMFEVVTKEKGLDLISQIEIDPHAAFMLDEIRLRQVLINMVGNAVKFTDEGHISIRVTSRPSWDHQASDLIIQVADTGIGIPEAQQALIFESFRQQEGQSNTQYGGTGLGLTITKRLVELMNGQITVESKAGKGAVFTIVFKDILTTELEIEKERVLPDENIKEHRFNPARVLLVDDVVSNRQLIKDQLENTGLTVIDVSDGPEALKWTEKQIPDLILTDIRMPGMDGFQLLEKFKQQPDIKNIPVIAITASVSTETEKIDFSDFDGFLLKPLDAGQLIREISRFIPSESSDDDARNTDAKLRPIKIETLKWIKTVPALIQKVKDEVMPELAQFNGAMEMDRVKNLVFMLRNLGDQFDIELLIRLSDELIQAADAFDIIETQRLIQSVSDWASSLMESHNDE